MGVLSPKGHSVIDTEISDYVKLPGIYTVATLPARLPILGIGTTAYASDANNGAGGLYVYTASGWVNGNGTSSQSSVFYPAALTSTGIAAAATAANAAGGGIVQLPPGTINLSGQSSLPLLAGVTYNGAGWIVNNSQALTGGTIITGDGTFDIFAGNATDLAGPYLTSSALTAAAISGCGVQNLGISTGLHGIKCGALFQAGAIYSNFKNLYIQGCTSWGFWQENFEQSTFDEIYAYNNTNNVGFFGSGQGVTGELYNFGNSRISKIVSGNTSGGARGQFIAVQGRYGSQLNNVVMRDFGASGNGFTSTQAATTYSSVASTITGSSASIAVSNTAGAFLLGSAVKFSATVGSGTGTQVVSGTIYFVALSSTSAIQVAAGYNPRAIMASGSPSIYVPMGANVALPYTVNSQVQFATTVGQITAGTAYYVTAVSGQNIQVATTSGGTAITLNAGGVSAIFGSASATSPFIVPSAGGTPTLSSSSIGVTDLSKFPQGSPVSFASSANGFTQNAVYFVQAASGTTGAGFVNLLSDKDLGVQLVANGTTAQNIVTQGFPNLEIGAQDMGSAVTYSSLDGANDIETGGTANIVLAYVLGFEGRFGLAAGTGVTQSLVLRNAQLVSIIAQQSMKIDADFGFQFSGPTPTIQNVGPMGIMQAGQNGPAALNLSHTSNTLGDVSSQSNFFNQLVWNTPMALPASQQATATTLSTGSGTIITFSTAAGGTLILPALSTATQLAGWWYFINNPQNNTVAVTATNNIIGLGSNLTGATGFTMAAYSSALVVAQNNGGTMYWARYA